MRSVFLFMLSALLFFSLSAQEKITFSKAAWNTKDGIPGGCTFRGRTRYPYPVYSIVPGENGGEALRIDCTKASGMLIFDVSAVIKKYPVVRWKWRVLKFPEKADGRDVHKDDQAIVIYLVSGQTAPVCAACRWDTLTPKFATGQAMYALGMSTVYWKTLRNESDGTGKWYVETADLYQELMKNLNGKRPEKIGLVIGSNTQCTGSVSSAEIEYIEFLPAGN